MISVLLSERWPCDTVDQLDQAVRQRARAGHGGGEHELAGEALQLSQQQLLGRENVLEQRAYLGQSFRCQRHGLLDGVELDAEEWQLLRPADCLVRMDDEAEGGGDMLCDEQRLLRLVSGVVGE